MIEFIGVLILSLGVFVLACIKDLLSKIAKTLDEETHE